MLNRLNALPFKTKLYIHYLLCLAGSIVMMASGEFANVYPLLITGILILASGLVFRMLLIKCPHCGDGLYQHRADLKNCPNCGKELT